MAWEAPSAPRGHPSPRSCTSQRQPCCSPGPQGGRGSSSPAPRPRPDLHTTAQLPEGGSVSVPGPCSAPQDPRNPRPQTQSPVRPPAPSARPCTPLEPVPRPGARGSPLPQSQPEAPAGWQTLLFKGKCLQTSGALFCEDSAPRLAGWEASERGACPRVLGPGHPTACSCPHPVAGALPLSHLLGGPFQLVLPARLGSPVPHKASCVPVSSLSRLPETLPGLPTPGRSHVLGLRAPIKASAPFRGGETVLETPAQGPTVR